MCYLQKNNSDVKTFEMPKKLKNHKIYFLYIFENFEIKKNVFDYTIEKYKRKIDYFQILQKIIQIQMLKLPKCQKRYIIKS